MKEKILALLKTKFTGVREDGLNLLAGVLAFQIDTEEKASEVVGALTADQVSSYISEWRKAADAEITKSNKTYEEGLKKKFDFVEKGKADPQPNPKPEPDNIAEIIAKAVKEATQPLADKLSGLELEKASTARLNALNEKLKECNDETFKAKVLKDFPRMKFDNDEDFTAYLTDTEKDVTAANQNIANQGLGFFEKPSVINTQTGKEATKEELDAVMAKIPI